MRRLLAAATLALSACALPDHQNPYDPATPPALQARATLAGLVTLEAIGAAAPVLAGVSVSVPGVGVVTTDTGGAWSLPGVPPGSHAVQFHLDRYRDQSLTGVVVTLDDGEKTVAVPAVRLAAARGGVAGTVTATGAGSQAGTVVTVSGGPDGATTVTDAAGHWSVSGLGVGTGYVASYGRAAYAAGQSAAFAVTAEAVTTAPEATLALATTGSISGTAAVERGSAEGIAVTLAGADVNGAAVTRSTSTAAGGAWSLTGLPQGTYALAFTRSGYDGASLAGLVVGAGAASAPAVTLAVSLGTVAGTVALSAGAITGYSVGADLSGVVVTLGGVDVPVPASVTDASGAYRFERVPVSLGGASYTVAARKPFFTSQSTTVLALAGATAAAPALTLPVASGALSGTATLSNVTGGGDGLPSAGVSVSVTGTAFDGSSFSTAATSAANGAWTTAAMPPGSYDLIATATGRSCGAFARATVGSGAATAAGAVLCLDAVAPSGLVLGSPAVVPPQQAGYLAATSVVVPIATQATDLSSPSNLRGYQLARGPSPDWSAATLVSGAPTSLTFTGLATDARNVLWARPVDTAGNAGPAASLEVIQDSQDPAAPTMTTARPVVDATSATVTLSGSEGDANFLRYEVATGTVAATATCPASASGTFSPATASTALSLAAGVKSCVWGRAVDRAGRLSAQSLLEVTSDLTPPASPTIAPLYDPSLLTVHAEYADFFVTAPATDEPAGGGVAWRNVAWVEVDVGSGYRPLCPAASCRSGGAWNPCGCSCTDARLVCDGSTFRAVRVPLLDGTSNLVGIRAVDLAGNVGSGASQLVPTGTSLLPVDVGTESATNPRGRGRLLGYRFTDSFLKLRDLGADGRPDASDDACIIGALGSVVPRVAVLGPRAVVHGDGDLAVKVRRPGADGLFCSAAADDTTYGLYALAAGATVIRNVTGSLGYTRTGEYAAWVERTAGLDVVRVQAPNGSGLLAAGAPAPATLLTLPSGSNVLDLLMGGDCLLVTTGFPLGFRVACKAGGLGSATGVTTWTLPSTALAASLSDDGLLLGWMESDGGAPRLHVRRPGGDRLYGTSDDLADVTRLAPGTAPSAADLAIQQGHLVVSETAASSATYWLLHWAAGPDGIFDAAAGADDTVSRLLPSSMPRPSPSLLSGGVLAYGVYGDGGNLADVVASDLSTYRWEAIEAKGLDGLTSNGNGTLFFLRGGTLTAREPGGGEQQPGIAAASFAATGSSLVTVEGTKVNLYRKAGASWSVAPTTIHTGTPWQVAAGDDLALVMTSEGGGTRYRVADLTAASPTATLLPVVAGTVPGNNGFGVSSLVVAYQCLSSGWNACVHQPGADGKFGTADDVTLVLHQPGTATAYGAYGLAVWGDRIAFQDATGRMVVVSAGPDGLFNTSDDLEDVLGPAASGAAGNLAVAGNYAAWLQVAGSNGIQVMVADLTKGTQRQLSHHYAMKQSLSLDPSGRLTWIDFGFSSPAIFLAAP